ncbi:MAG: HIT family protein [bacterium]
MENCIFCKIVKGELEAKKVHENESVLAFIPKEQVSKGHTLVIPKEHYENIFDIPEKLLEQIMMISQELSQRYKTEFGATGVNILHASGKDAQQSVFHFHMHVIPRYLNDGLDLWIKAGIEKE